MGLHRRKEKGAQGSCRRVGGDARRDKGSGESKAIPESGALQGREGRAGLLQVGGGRCEEGRSGDL